MIINFIYKCDFYLKSYGYAEKSAFKSITNKLRMSCELSMEEMDTSIMGFLPNELSKSINKSMPASNIVNEILNSENTNVVMGEENVLNDTLNDPNETNYFNTSQLVKL